MAPFAVTPSLGLAGAGWTSTSRDLGGRLLGKCLQYMLWFSLSQLGRTAVKHSAKRNCSLRNESFDTEHRATIHALIKGRYSTTSMY